MSDERHQLPIQKKEKKEYGATGVSETARKFC